MKISLIIPTRNEAGAIGQVLNEIPKGSVDEIIVVDGHSTDQTVRNAKSMLRPKVDKIILQKSSGFGRAVLQGLSRAKGDVLIIMNGDGSHDPKDIPLLIMKITEGCDYILASRYAPGGKSEDDTLVTFLGNKFFTWLTNFIHGTCVFDSLYFFTAITRKGLKKLHLSSPGFELCIETLIRAHRASLVFGEVPAIERPRLAGKTKVNALRDGFKILKMILKNY